MSQRPLRFALFGNVYQHEKSAAIAQVLDCLRQHRAQILIDEAYFDFLRCSELISMNDAQTFCGNDFEADFAVSMGGDGTFLQAASRVGCTQIPIVGINMGRLGFLADITPNSIEACIEALYRGDYAVEDRALIQVEGMPDMPVGNTGITALNDVAILKRDTASMISIHTSINGEYLTTYQADGLVVSTPTGSTAYSLSNGGPIIVPGTSVFSLTAVAPHSLNVRPIVIPDSSVIELTVSSRSHTFLVAIDGRSEKLPEGTTLRLCRAPYNVRVVKRAGQMYFSILRQKMMWGADVR